MMQRSVGVRFVVGMVVLATLAAACGDDGSGGSGGDGSTTTVTAVDGDDSAVPTTTSEAAAEGDQPVVLTDSFTGVTSERITVGVAAPDLEALRGLVDLDHGSYEAAYGALLADLNRRGGILGREVEMVFEAFLPIGTEGMDTICARFVDDEEIFVVMGALFDDGPLCYTQLSDTAVIGSTQNDARLAASQAPWFTGDRNTDDRVEAVLRGFAARGILDGQTVGVVGAIADQGVIERVAVPVLADLGVEVADVSFIEASPIDTVASDTETSLIAERQETLGVTLALAIEGGTPLYVGGLEDLTFRPRIATTSLSSLRAFIRDRGGRDLSVLSGSVAGNTAEQLGWWADPALQDCIAVVEAAGEPPVLDPNTRAPDEPENIVSVARACRDVSLFEAIATAAGPDLTNDTFRTAGETLGEFHIPGYGPGFYDAETPDGAAPIYFYEWDEELQDLASDGSTL